MIRFIYPSVTTDASILTLKTFTGYTIQRVYGQPFMASRLYFYTLLGFLFDLEHL